MADESEDQKDAARYMMRYFRVCTRVPAPSWTVENIDLLSVFRILPKTAKEERLSFDSNVEFTAQSTSNQVTRAPTARVPAVAKKTVAVVALRLALARSRSFLRPRRYTLDARRPCWPQRG